MNEFIEQFIIESRELIEQAMSALGALEHASSDADNLDALFRAIHTLKGGASIVEFTAMEQAVHAVESELTHLRTKKLPIARKAVDDCVACLDQIARWLDSMEQSGEIPINAGADAQKLIARIGDATQRAESIDAPTKRNRNPDWVAALLKSNSAVAVQANTAVRITPHPDSFLRGEDPLATIALLPDLLALDLRPVDVLPTLDTLDPFQSMLVMTALSAAPVDEVSRLLQPHADVTEVIALADAARRHTALSDVARKILEAQVALLERVETAAFAGRVRSAGRVAANVFRRGDRVTNVEAVMQAMEKSLAERNAVYLKNEIAESLLAQRSSTATSVSPAPSQSLPRNLPQSLRVDADRIDDFVRLAGELTVVKNAIGHAAKLAMDSENPLAAVLQKNHSSLNQITSELQRSALGMRVLPLNAVLQRFTRVVREMAANLHKPTHLVIEGGDTEADKAIVEMLFEPLLHIVRNSMDHGIEDAATRAARNKPESATIRVSASRGGDQVNVEIQDDGGGIDIARVRSVAIERGIVTPEGVAAMSEADIVDLVFAPGFSTAREVTELSGRGVGMDAVRTAVTRMGGKVSLESSFQVGATVHVTLPFSILITHVMTVEADGQAFGIPLDSIVETISVPAASIVGIGAARAVVRRNQTIPIFDLAGLLRVGERNRNKADVLVVITSIAGQLGGIEVDRLGERMEVILKPLDGMLSGVPGNTGTTILGDGRVLLILDLEGLMQ